MPQQARNRVKIIMHEQQIEVEPPYPEVRAGFDPLHVAIDWSDNNGVWDILTVQNFTTSDGNIETVPATTTFLMSEGNVVKKIDFKLWVSEDVCCNYELEYERIASQDAQKEFTRLKLVPPESSSNFHALQGADRKSRDPI